MDARRLANNQGLTLKGPKRIYNGELSSIGMLYAQQAGFFDCHHLRIFEWFWNHELDVDSMADMKLHIENVGGPSSDFEFLPGTPVLTSTSQL